MGRIKNELIKHARIYGVFIKSCVMQQLEFRLNFFTYFAAECGFLVSKLLYVVVVYTTGIKISGLSPDEISLFIATFLLVTAAYTAFFMDNIYGVPELVRTGSLDMLITKPVSLQFLVSLRKFNLALPIPNTVAGIVLLCVSWRKIGISVTPANILLYLYMLVCSIVLAYSLFMLPALLAFKFVKMNGVMEMTDKMWDFNNMPMQIYKKWMQRVGIFAFPVFAITNIPPLALLHRLSAPVLVWAAVLPLLLFGVTRFCFTRAVRGYSSSGG